MNLDRTKAEAIAKEESAIADMKQHADKLIQGFEKMDDSHAKRAVWELVQNACDLTEECKITIDFRNGGFSFSHNGKPFTSKTLISLIKQVSSKPPESTDDVGQFGTGFITTHSFGKKFRLNSILKEGEHYIEIKNFIIDRYAKSSDTLVDKLHEQQNDVYQLLRGGKVLETPQIKTTFTYIPESQQNKTNIKEAEKNLHHYVPYVLALNSTLSSVKVIGSDERITQYEKNPETENNGVICIPIKRDNQIVNVYCLRNEGKSIQIILPLSERYKTKQLDDLVAKLFLFFPLIGTEGWGCNFIIHSKLFAPTEPRDGLHLKSNNEQTQEKERENRRILEEASTMIYDFVEKNACSVKDPINLANINFRVESDNRLLNSYFRELKKIWSDRFKMIDLVDIHNERLKPNEALFFSSELLQSEYYLDSIYILVSKFWGTKIPKKEIVKKWSGFVDKWDNDSIQFISIKKILNKIQEVGSLSDFDQNALHNFYKYLIEEGSEHLLDDYRLLPNIKNQLVKKGELKKPQNIDAIFISIADNIIPDAPQKFISSEFELDLEFPGYTRKNLSDEFNSKIFAATKDLSVVSSSAPDKSFLDGLISLCSIYTSETVQSGRRQIMPRICEFYELNYEEKFIPNIDEDKFDYDYTPFRALIKIFLIDIVKKSKDEVEWVNNNIGFLHDCLTIVTNLGTLDNIVDAIPVFPNQNFILRKKVDLKKGKNFPSNDSDDQFLKDSYDNLFQSNVREELVLNDFENFLNHENELSGFELSRKIEQRIKEEGSFEEIINHPYKGLIFQIIQRITNNKEWSDFFEIIEDKKAIIMMAKISDDDLKDDLFSIIGLDDKDKIALLGELSKNEELERIISLGKKAVDEEDQSQDDFDFKKQIGVHIENLIRNKIERDLVGLSVKISELQGGQDIIVSLDGEIKYYIEVKSRWNIRSSIIMSNKQIKKSVEFKDNYSLCCVEMSDYYPSDNSRHQVDDINKITERIKFINDIGYKIEPLISTAISVEEDETHVKLIDDYRAVIPQPVVNEGIALDKFVNYLIDTLNLSN